MEVAPPYGAAEALSPLVRRVTANNPGPFTGPGTSTFLIGRGELAVIDPGPDDPAHLDALLRATDGERVAAILITHTHRDHSPLAAALRERTGAPVIGAAPLAPPPGQPGAEAFDTAYAPDRVLDEGESVVGEGWTLTALATPGHASNHLAFAFPQERTLFSGDHVMGWSTSVVAPPDGDMGAYMASLERLIGSDSFDFYRPTHGGAVEEPRRRARHLLLHRRQREAQILGLLRGGPAVIRDLVARAYPSLDPRLLPAAGLSVLAHLELLERQGAARRDGETWALT